MQWEQAQPSGGESPARRIDAKPMHNNIRLREVG